jgi:hypothetical protein
MNKKREQTAAGVTYETLEETPNRVLTFLMAVGVVPAVRTILRLKGYNAAEHRRGWALIEQLGNRELDATVTEKDIADAVAAIDNWDEPNIRLIRAALTRHPEARAMVLAGITAQSGPAAVINVSKILRRLDELAKTEAGREALATLSERGLGDAERKRMAALVKIAKSGGIEADAEADNADSAALEAADDAALKAAAEAAAAEAAAYEKTLVELRQWWDEWSEIARINIQRRDYLIRLGLAERRSPSGDDEVADPSPFITDPSKPDGDKPRPRPGS